MYWGAVSSVLGEVVCKEHGREGHAVLWVHLPGLIWELGPGGQWAGLAGWGAVWQCLRLN